ncbi:MAG: hypothetical protein GIX03_09890 [Candidatus Eremiobacteraeota bacterium]|nr:hypothetical protein [Candidatus Eremiobacteraeota bacterium]MBC5803280.1 hypothetical protein [Candidatus Eremiobacteraeota bacterium]MBC5822192.1 hypothetical protein [Candidatus Eremiobacteraeota bacterium]
MTHESHASAKAESDPVVVGHYELVAPLIAASFGGTPVAAASYPDGYDGDAQYYQHAALPIPRYVSTVAVPTVAGERRYVAVSPEALTWMARDHGAVTFFGWSPTPEDPRRCGYARIIVEPFGGADNAAAAQAAAATREQLHEQDTDAILLRSGAIGYALYVPLADGPSYLAVRPWLEDIRLHASLAFELISAYRHMGRKGAYVFLSVETNTPGRVSALPYALRPEELAVVTPLRWENLESGSYWTVADARERLAAEGDVFAAERARIGACRLPKSRGIPLGMSAPLEPVGELQVDDPQPRAHVLDAALAILADGKPREAGEILAAGIARKLLPATLTRKAVYILLEQYIARTQGRGRTPRIVQDPDRRFRVNHFRDDWPAPPALGEPAAAAPPEIARQLAASSRGADPAAFERAACDAFAHLGFLATHVGGEGAPDGLLRAPLGGLGYGVALEMKTAGSGVVKDPDAAEARKNADASGMEYAALVGPEFGDDVEFLGELQTHRVAAFTVADLALLLDRGSDPYEMRTLFAPGIVADRLDDLLWMRDHGESKRVAVVAGAIVDAGYAAQSAVAVHGTPHNAPTLTADAAMLLVDERLASAGVSDACTREQVQAAFAYLTSPLVRRAVWADDTRQAIVVVRAL